MNRYQKVVVVVAVLNMALMLLFPPTLDKPMLRATLPSFAGFQPFFAIAGGLRVFDVLLSIEILFVGANAMAGWLALSRAAARPPTPGRITLGIGIFAVVNLAVVLLFPPFETYSGLLRNTVTTFDGFYFVVGERSGRAIFTPILHLELLLLGANVLALWLLFGLLEGTAPRDSEAILDMARDLPTEDIVRLSEEMLRHAVARAPRKSAAHRHDRRSVDEADYPGLDRRQGDERRKRPR